MFRIPPESRANPRFLRLERQHELQTQDMIRRIGLTYLALRRFRKSSLSTDATAEGNHPGCAGWTHQTTRCSENRTPRYPQISSYGS